MLGKVSGFSSSGLRMLHGAVQQALEEDDNLPPSKKKYEVRECSDWKIWTDTIEAELDSRGVFYTKIAWDTRPDL